MNGCGFLCKPKPCFKNNKIKSRGERGRGRGENEGIGEGEREVLNKT